MRPTEPLALHHSWPLFERAGRFALGQIHDEERHLTAGDLSALRRDQMTTGSFGRWACDLADGRLDWSDGVYDIFGLPRGARMSRDETVALYREGSRAAMERLRAYAIRHRRGFTIDVEIQAAAGGDMRWMRLIAAPVCEDGRVVRLQGVKRRLAAACSEFT